MDSQNRPVHFLVTGLAIALLAFSLALHAVGWCEPEVPLDDLYEVYLFWEQPLLYFWVFEGFLGILLMTLFPRRPKPHNWDFIFCIGCGIYVLYCKMQHTGMMVRHEAAGWFAYSFRRAFPLTEEKAFHNIWGIVRTCSAAAVVAALILACAFIGSMVLTWRHARQGSRRTGEFDPAETATPSDAA